MGGHPSWPPWLVLGALLAVAPALFEAEAPPAAPKVGSGCGSAAPLPLEDRVEAALAGALLADAFAAPSHGEYDPAKARAAVSAVAARTSTSAPQSECGDELRHALEVVAQRGFEFSAFAASWRGWAEGYEGARGPGAREALRNLARGTPAHSAGSHYIDLSGAVRVPALLLLAGRVDDEGLALASREMQAVSHENPKALQAGELLLRAALLLLRRPAARNGCGGGEATAGGGTAGRQAAMAAALRAAAGEAGPQYRPVVDEALAEAQSRDALLAVSGTGALAEWHSDSAVIGRMTSSGDVPGQEVQSGLTPFAMPAIIWFAVAYNSLQEAALANAMLGGESAARAIFVGLLHAAVDGPSALEGGDGSAATQVLPSPMIAAAQLRSKVPAFLTPLQLCAVPGHCQGRPGGTTSGERVMHGVAVAAAVEAAGAAGARARYRVYVRIDASDLLQSPAAVEQPPDWDEEEDGPWEPPADPARDGRVECLARYFQFTTRSGRHAPFGLWPAHRLCRLSRDMPVAHDAFDVVLPVGEHLASVIGGVVVGSAARDAKLPSLLVEEEAEAPPWADACERIGAVRLPEGKWTLADDDGAADEDDPAADKPGGRSAATAAVVVA